MTNSPSCQLTLKSLVPIMGGWAGHKHTEDGLEKGSKWRKAWHDKGTCSCVLACGGSQWSLRFFRSFRHMGGLARRARSLEHIRPSEMNIFQFTSHHIQCMVFQNSFSFWSSSYKKKVRKKEEEKIFTFFHCTGLISNQWLDFYLAFRIHAAYLQHAQGV